MLYCKINYTTLKQHIIISINWMLFLNCEKINMVLVLQLEISAVIDEITEKWFSTSPEIKI